ncbi:MAG: hypothetical protein JSV80_12435 [Acidobacteriota bacterium]|nr:MAG: hypothetical protein JSV80_12435 [Acidobacteriota bacterium]
MSLLLMAVAVPTNAEPDAEVTCEAASTLPAREGPAGLTCRDGKDNDADGLVDLDDSQCRSALPAVRWALSAVSERPGRNCTGQYHVEYEVSGANPGAKVIAELLALDESGEILETVPVENGAEVFLGVPPDHRPLPSSGLPHDAMAELVVLRVTADDGSHAAQAYCSNVPCLEMIEPLGRAVSASRGAVTEVITALPQVHPIELDREGGGTENRR